MTHLQNSLKASHKFCESVIDTYCIILVMGSFGIKGAFCAILLYLESPNCPIVRFVNVLTPSYVNNAFNELKDTGQSLGVTVLSSLVVSWAGFEIACGGTGGCRVVNVTTLLFSVYIIRTCHWGGGVIVLVAFSSLAALEVVILKISSAANGTSCIGMTMFLRQWMTSELLRRSHVLIL